ncbi:hypothetical protein OEZ60_14600 [Defluviimonas sp. WL0024]|uniref:UrcA family protein n=2 Tax=Albidovulum TaxID=205889 RepID=A0ABT3J4N7_9RHOB|nr:MULTISPECIES: hypothetical protein [Defluviimonas]MCU9849231.1 hypothetical protein [Defluviimonas sp. WL0024]MCW3782642.1 hypothetical protein [Defluviimonas salinarum]
MRIPVALAAVGLLPGCVAVITADATRKESRLAIDKVLSAERPDLPAEAGGCVLKAMTLPESVQLGLADNYKAVSAENRALILSYADRPKAAACIAALPAAATE